MKSERVATLELLERRLELVGSLIHVDAQWRRAYIELNLEHSERCAAEQERLSEQVREIDKEISFLERREAGSTAPAAMDSVTDRKIRDALDRMNALHLELRRSNEIRKSILKRSKITINALRNLFNSHATSYAAPVPSATGTIYEERV